MLLHEAVATFRRAARDGAVPNLKTGRHQQLSAGARDAIISSVRGAVRRATGLTERAELDAVDLRPYLHALPALALQYARDHGLGDPHNYADRARRFLRTLESHLVDDAGASHSVPLPWQPLLQRLPCPEQVADVGRLACLVLVGGGVSSPDAMPGADTLCTWARAQHVPRKQLSRWLAAYRTAVLSLDAHAAAAFPKVFTLPPHHAVGLRSLPDLDARLLDAGCRAPASDLSLMRLLEYLAPCLCAELHWFLTDGESSGPAMSESRRHTFTAAVCRFAAEAAQEGCDLARLTLGDLVTQTRSYARATRRNALASSFAPPTARVERRLLDVLADRAALASMRGSPITLHDDGPADRTAAPKELKEPSVGSTPGAVGSDGGLPETPHVPYYPEVIEIYVNALAVVSRELYADAATTAPERWALLTTAYKSTLRRMRLRNRSARTLGKKDKDLLLSLVTYPQLVCVGLPGLAAHVRKLEARWVIARRDGDGGDPSPAARAAHAAYARALRQYVALALAADDGLRVKNYARAVVGTHVLLTWGRRTGDRPAALARVETAFRGFDAHDAGLKQKKDANGDERRRSRTLRPGIVDMELLGAYLSGTRVDALVGAGDLPAREAYDPGRDAFPLFPAPGGGGRPLDAQDVSAEIGRALHWVCRHALGRSGVPAWEHPDRTRRFRGLFAAHAVRLLIGTYWGGVRGRWQTAADLLNNNVEMIMRRYSRASARMADLRARSDMENPDFFNERMDAIYDRGQA